REFDPARRVQIIASAGFMGHPSSQPMLERAFERAGSVDRRQAVTALARIDSAEVRERLHALIEGDYEEAVYDISEDAPVLEEQRDLRAHAVSGLLGQGKPEDIARLIERSRKSPEDDAVAHYVEKFFPAVKRPGFVKDVVDIMIERGRLSTEFLLYISRVGTAADLPEVRRLEALGREGDDRTRVQSLIDANW
ncbi:MAG: hypothetical protein KDB53_00805, partial [Planctomycetes bacterium]|nr:hypothetical protein [Planctomycetota bacterium]